MEVKERAGGSFCSTNIHCNGVFVLFIYEKQVITDYAGNISSLTEELEN